MKATKITETLEFKKLHTELDELINIKYKSVPQIPVTNEEFIIVGLVNSIKKYEKEVQEDTDVLEKRIEKLTKCCHELIDHFMTSAESGISNWENDPIVTGCVEIKKKYNLGFPDIIKTDDLQKTITLLQERIILQENRIKELVTGCYELIERFYNHIDPEISDWENDEFIIECGNIMIKYNLNSKEQLTTQDKKENL